MNQQQKKAVFLQSVENQLINLYDKQKERGEKNALLKHRVEGFMFAGIVVEIATNEELKDLIDKIYFATFGMTSIERKLQKEKGETEEVDWSFYDIPPSKR